jgi:bacteriocin-like protein
MSDDVKNEPEVQRDNEELNDEQLDNVSGGTGGGAGAGLPSTSPIIQRGAKISPPTISPDTLSGEKF